MLCCPLLCVVSFGAMLMLSTVPQRAAPMTPTQLAPTAVIRFAPRHKGTSCASRVEPASSTTQLPPPCCAASPPGQVWYWQWVRRLAAEVAAAEQPPATHSVAEEPPCALDPDIDEPAATMTVTPIPPPEKACATAGKKKPKKQKERGTTVVVAPAVTPSIARPSAATAAPRPQAPRQAPTQHTALASIELLHRYNEVRDAAHEAIALLASLHGLSTREMHTRVGAPLG
jgi:hypothetical protein